MLMLFLWSCTRPCESPYAHGETTERWIGNTLFQRQAITEGICGPAFGRTADLDGDGQLELVISNFGRSDGFSLANGFVSVLSHEGNLQSWFAESALPASLGYKWPNSVELTDMDGDNDVDILVGAGFLTCSINPWTGPCGALFWLENRQHNRNDNRPRHP